MSIAGPAWCPVKNVVARSLLNGEDWVDVDHALPGANARLTVIPLAIILYIGVRRMPSDDRYPSHHRFYLYAALVALVLTAAYGAQQLGYLVFGRRMV